MAVFETSRKMTAREQTAYELGKLDAVKHGRWIEKTGRAMCSICADECWADGVMEYNYCPNCGAKMDGEENG